MEDNKWNLIKDKLPPENTLVLCQGERGSMFIGEFYCYTIGNEKQYASVPNSRTGRYAIAWQHLPKPLNYKK